MKRGLIALVVLLALVALVTVPVKTANADSASCWADPDEIHIKDSVAIYCDGFSPDTWLWAYYVEPDGSATALASLDTGNSIKSDENGRVAFTLTSYIGVAGMAVGNWQIVVSEKGLNNVILNEGVANFRVLGGSEGVAGAHIWTDPDTLTKDEWTVIYGEGFAAGEMVSLWWEYPNGDCSSYTYHDGMYNTPGFRGFSSYALWDVKTDADGAFATVLNWSATACEGKYRIVARGNSSGWGGETWVSVTGNAVATDAWLDASPDTVAAMFDWVYFTGAGFGANEHLSCWLRTPQGQVTAVDQLWHETVKSDAGGNMSLAIYTGSFYPPFAYASEGALGVYAMTCRGDVSGATGIAEFTVTGGTFDP